MEEFFGKSARYLITSYGKAEDYHTSKSRRKSDGAAKPSSQATGGRSRSMEMGRDRNSYDRDDDQYERDGSHERDSSSSRVRSASLGRHAGGYAGGYTDGYNRGLQAVGRGRQPLKPANQVGVLPGKNSVLSRPVPLLWF